MKHADVSFLLCHPTFLNHDYVERLEEAIPALAVASDGPHFLAQVPLLRGISVWGSCDRRWAVGGEAQLVEDGRSLGLEFVREIEATVSPADPAVIVYTSGSTADPKGIVHSHGAVVRHSYNLTFTYVTTASDVLFTSMPFFWIGGLITGLLAVVHHGATIVTQPSFDAGEALELMEREKATIAQGWPQQGTTLLEHPQHPTTDLSSLRRTSMPSFVPEAARPPAISSMALGMTEACSCHTNFDPYVPLDESKRGTFGPSIEGLQHKVIDPHTGAELPPGAEGEICVRGYSMMLGLHKVERHDTFDADGWYHTGDAGRLDEEGWLYFTGRLGEMIKTSGGANVTPAEVEAALASHADVLEAYVTGVPDPRGTAGTQLVAAAVVPVAGSVLDAHMLAGVAQGGAVDVQGPEADLDLRQGRAAVHRLREDQEIGTGSEARTPDRRLKMQSWEVSAREAVRHTLSSYNFGGDRGRLDELAWAFAPEGILEIVGREPVVGREAILDKLRQSIQLDPAPRFVHHHVTGVHFISVTGTSGRGRQLLPGADRCRPRSLGPLPRPVRAGRRSMAHRSPADHHRCVRLHVVFHTMNDSANASIPAATSDRSAPGTDTGSHVTPASANRPRRSRRSSTDVLGSARPPAE